MTKLYFLTAAAAVAMAFLATSLLPTAALEEGKKDEKPAAGEAKAGGDSYELVAPLAAVMEVMDDVFQKIPDKAKAGKFKDVKRESLFVAEIANLAKHFKDHRGKKEYLNLAETMKLNALKMAESAEKKEESGVKAIHAKVTEVCDSCHEKFRDV